MGLVYPAQEEYIYINVVFNLLATWNSHFSAQFLLQLLFLRFVRSKFLSPGEIFSLISRVRVTSATLTGSWRSKTIFKKSGHYKKIKEIRKLSWRQQCLFLKKKVFLPGPTDILQGMSWNSRSMYDWTTLTKNYSTVKGRQGKDMPHSTLCDHVVISKNETKWESISNPGELASVQCLFL